MYNSASHIDISTMQSIDDVQDEVTVQLIKENSENFTIIFNKYYWRIFHYTYRRLEINNRTRLEDAEDITMIAFENTLKAIKKHDKVRSVMALLFQYAKYCIIAKVLHPRKYSRVVENYEDNTTFNQTILISDFLTPEQIVISNEFFSKISKLIISKGDVYWTIAKMFYIEDYEQAEISKTLNLSISTIEGRIGVIKKLIAKEFRNNHIQPKKVQVKLNISDAEIYFIKENFYSMKLSEIHRATSKMRDIPIHIETLRKYCNKELGLYHDINARPTGIIHEFNEQDIHILINNYKKITLHRILTLINAGKQRELPLYALHKQVSKLKKNNLLK